MDFPVSSSLGALSREKTEKTEKMVKPVEQPLSLSAGLHGILVSRQSSIDR
jgi:hypothetical protein